MKQVKYYSTSYSSAQFKVACMCPEKPICAPPRLSDVSPTSPLKHCTTKEQKAYGSMKETVSALSKARQKRVLSMPKNGRQRGSRTCTAFHEKCVTARKGGTHNIIHEVVCACVCVLSLIHI